MGWQRGVGLRLEGTALWQVRKRGRRSERHISWWWRSLNPAEDGGAVKGGGGDGGFKLCEWVLQSLSASLYDWRQRKTKHCHDIRGGKKKACSVLLFLLPHLRAES